MIGMVHIGEMSVLGMGRSELVRHASTKDASMSSRAEEFVSGMELSVMLTFALIKDATTKSRAEESVSDMGQKLNSTK